MKQHDVWNHLDIPFPTRNSICTRAVISRGLYTFLPHFQRPFIYCDLWPCVWLVFKSGSNKEKFELMYVQVKDMYICIKKGKSTWFLALKI